MSWIPIYYFICWKPGTPLRGSNNPIQMLPDIALNTIIFIPPSENISLETEVNQITMVESISEVLHIFMSSGHTSLLLMIKQNLVEIPQAYPR